MSSFTSGPPYLQRRHEFARAHVRPTAGAASFSASAGRRAHRRRPRQPERCRARPSCSVATADVLLARCAAVASSLRAPRRLVRRTEPSAATLVAAVEAVCLAHNGGDYVPEYRLWRAGQNNSHFAETILARPDLSEVRCVRPTCLQPPRRVRASVPASGFDAHTRRWTEMDVARVIASSTDVPKNADGTPARRVPLFVFRDYGGWKKTDYYTEYPHCEAFVDLPRGWVPGSQRFPVGHSVLFTSTDHGRPT